MSVVSRRSMKPLMRLLALAVAALGLGTPASAEPWPDLSLVRVSDSTTVSTRTLTRAGNWVVVVVRPGCRPCQDIVRHFGAEAMAGRLDPARLLVVLSGLEDAEAAAVRAGAPGIPAHAWLSDPAGTAVSVLDVRVAPAVYGIRRGDITWSLRGSQFSAAFLRDLIAPWLR